MIVPLIIATVIGTTTTGAGTDPLESALEYVNTMEKTVAATEAQEAAAIAEAERQQAIDRASREADRQTTPQPSNESSNGSLPSLLLTIRANESGGNYGAVNWDGCEGYGCFGAYQMHGLYADDWARRYGAASYAGTSPSQWPSGIQDRVALGLFYSTSPDGEHWCAWTDYC